jgi:AraC-like DNA-binding protein
MTKRGKVLPDKILAFWIVIIGIHLLGYYFNQLGYWEKYPHLIGVTAPVPLFHGPLLYLYCLFTFRSENKIRRVDFLHFLPPVVAYLYMLKFFLLYTPEQKLMVDKGELNEYFAFSVVLLFAILISGIAYSFLSYRLTIKYKRKIESRFSYHEGISLNWLRYCIVGIALVFASAIIVFVLRDTFNVNFPFNPEYIIYTILIGFIFYLGYFGIKHENIFLDSRNDDFVNKKSSCKKKYKNSGLKDDVLRNYYEKLIILMEEEKPYLQPKLNLSELAEQLEISGNQLSQIINQMSGVNFHDFVNKYRIEEFLNLAKKNNNFSLLAVALEAGFNSKSSFNSVFRKQKGCSPSQYLKRY